MSSYNANDAKETVRSKIESLEGHTVRLERENADLRERLARAEQRAESIYQTWRKTAAYTNTLADALRKYGTHSWDCQSRDTQPPFTKENRICNCGLVEALASAQPPQPNSSSQIVKEK